MNDLGPICTTASNSIANVFLPFEVFSLWRLHYPTQHITSLDSSLTSRLLRNSTRGFGAVSMNWVDRAVFCAESTPEGENFAAGCTVSMAELLVCRHHCNPWFVDNVIAISTPKICSTGDRMAFQTQDLQQPSKKSERRANKNSI